jgi:hypothetical protein
VISLSKGLSRKVKKNLLILMLKSDRYQKEILPTVIRSGVLGRTEEILNFVPNDSSKMAKLAQIFLSPDLFLKQNKSNQKKIVEASLPLESDAKAKKLRKKLEDNNFLRKLLDEDEQNAIKILISAPQRGFDMMIDGVLRYDRDYQIFESKYISDQEVIKIAERLNERRLNKVLSAPMNFLLISHAARLDLQTIFRLFEISDSKTIQRFVDYCLKPGTRYDGVRRITARQALEVIMTNMTLADKNQEWEFSKLYQVKLFQNPDLLIRLLKKMKKDPHSSKIIKDFAANFSDARDSQKLSAINRKQLLIDLLAAISFRKDLLDKVFESVSNEYTLKIEKLLKEEK